MSEPLEDHDSQQSDVSVLTAEPPKTEPKRSARPPARARQAAPAPRVPAATPWEDEPESFWERFRVILILGVVAAAAGAWLLLRAPGEKREPARKAPEQVIRVQLPPLPPPPPPPPPKIKPPEPPKDEKRPETPQEAKPEPKPEAPKPVEKPPEGLGTNLKGPGAGLAGLGSSGNGMIGGTGSGTGGGGSMAKWYGGQVANRIQSTLRSHPKTQRSRMTVDAQIWVGGDSRIERAKLENSTGDSALDAALTGEILPGLQISEPPPPSVRMPIRLRLRAIRPN